MFHQNKILPKHCKPNTLSDLYLLVFLSLNLTPSFRKKSPDIIALFVLAKTY